ncbi:MAG TPA: M14 metallopeptidase family protein [Thermoanaerobaculia bacterium]|nr:M14 metallopeptidase family protein [Thermoanaerobaculia bacterium]
MRRLSLCVFVLLVAVASHAQTAIPAPDEFLGYKLGDRFTPHARILDYFHLLTTRSNLITMQQFGETYEHRPLMLAVITSPKNRAALDSIRANVAALTDPNATTQTRANEIAKSTPAIAWLAFGVHGNESSSAEVSMDVAHTLLTDPNSAPLLDNLVVIIDPLLNPDGRERYISWFVRTRGEEADPNPDAFEHNEPWPGGRFNHYLIDMNRDWAWSSQREVRARVAEYTKWNPQVFVDFHEMGYQSSYFFPPDARPVNANLPKDVDTWLEKFGRADAEAFTKKGWTFFTGEEFDLFYPGYGDSWPSLHGAIGMTYEVAGHSRAGSAITRDDATVYTLADRIARHYTTAMATLRTASENREGLLQYTYEMMRKQVTSGQNTYLLQPDSPNFRPLIEMLQRQSIAMSQLTAPLTIKASRIDSDAADTHLFPAGTVVINTRQPLGGLAQTLLERSPVFSKGYVEEQQKRAHADEPDEFYDLTSWSLPLAMNVDTYVTASPVTAELHPYAAAPQPSFRAARYGYVIDGGDPNVYRAAGRLLRDGIRFNVSEDVVNVNDRNFARGSVVVLKGNNKSDLDASLEKVIRDTGAAITPIDSGWTGATSFGSSKIHFIKDPRIALVGGPRVNSTSYGMLWHTLDVDTPLPHSNLSAESLRNVDLSKYGVIVLPDGDYGDRFGKNAEKLKSWLNAGGTLVVIKGASSFLREKDVDISKLKPWEAPKKKDDDKDKTPATPELYNDYRVPGATFRTTMNDRSYLTFGVPRSPNVLIEGSAAFLPVSHAVDNIVTITKEKPLVAGVAWNESIDRLKGSIYLVSEPYGRGQVITFADDPHFRLFWRGTLPLFLNAVLYSPSFPRL